jgi:hypothetical protein
MQHSTPTLNGVFSVLRSASKYGKLLTNGRNGSYLESSCATNLHFTPHVMLTSNKSAIQRLPSSATQSCLVNYSTDNIPCPISLALILMLPLIAVSQVRVRTGQGKRSHRPSRRLPVAIDPSRGCRGIETYGCKPVGLVSRVLEHALLRCTVTLV